jgi:hypothetical protein
MNYHIFKILLFIIKKNVFNYISLNLYNAVCMNSESLVYIYEIKIFLLLIAYELYKVCIKKKMLQ